MLFYGQGIVLDCLHFGRILFITYGACMIDYEKLHTLETIDAQIRLFKLYKEKFKNGTEEEKRNVALSIGVLSEFMLNNWLSLTQKKIDEFGSL